MHNKNQQQELLLIHSHYGDVPPIFAKALALGGATIVRELDLTDQHFEAASGLMTTTHLDQLGFMTYTEVLQNFLNRGGRWFFNGHFMRPLVPGLKTYVPIKKAKRHDLVLGRLNDHPVFAGIDQCSLETRKGVAGFYGRGHNPLPDGGLAINGIGPDLLPVDWVWSRPEGGHVFSHAGNDLYGMSDDDATRTQLTERIISWTAGELEA